MCSAAGGCSRRHTVSPCTSGRWRQQQAATLVGGGWSCQAESRTIWPPPPQGPPRTRQSDLRSLPHRLALPLPLPLPGHGGPSGRHHCTIRQPRCRPVRPPEGTPVAPVCVCVVMVAPLWMQATHVGSHLLPHTETGHGRDVSFVCPPVPVLSYPAQATYPVYVTGYPTRPEATHHNTGTLPLFRWGNVLVTVQSQQVRRCPPCHVYLSLFGGPCMPLLFLR